MIIKVLMGQREESYVGEYAPEALEVATEFDFEENPDFLLDRLAEERDKDHWESVVIVYVDVDMRALEKLLRPDNEIKGEVK